MGNIAIIPVDIPETRDGGGPLTRAIAEQHIRVPFWHIFDREVLVGVKDGKKQVIGRGICVATECSLEELLEKHPDAWITEARWAKVWHQPSNPDYIAQSI